MNASHGIIDHAEKVTADKTTQNLLDLGLDTATADKVLAFTRINGTLDEVKPQIEALAVDNAIFAEGVAELYEVYKLLVAQGNSDCVFIDLLIVRGLDYYTGTVYETMLRDYPEIGSISSGGRYDNLASSFTDQKLPGVGGSIGLTRLFYVLNEQNLLQDGIAKPIDVAIAPITEAEFAYSFELAGKLRAEGKIVDTVLTDKKLGDKLTYAAKIAKSAIVIGENEVKTGKYEVKEFK